MEDTVEIEVLYKGETLLFSATFIATAFMYKWRFIIEDIVVIFEHDEEGKYRASFESYLTITQSSINIELLQAIATTLDHLFD